MKSKSKATISTANRSFREISRKFLQSEIREHFWGDLLFFALIVALSAWALADAFATTAAMTLG